MKGSIIPYLTFHGQAKEAAEFYTELFGLVNLGVQRQTLSFIVIFKKVTSS